MSLTHEEFAANQNAPLPKLDDSIDLRGKTAIVTGCNSGIGYEIVRFYLSHGIEHVVAANRSPERSKAAMDKLLSETKRDARTVSIETVDMASLASVDAFAKRFIDSGRTLHILNSNAGTTRLPKRMTDDGFETVAQVNHLSLTYLALLLHPVLASTATADKCVTRSVITGSGGAFWVPFPEQTSERPIHDFSITKEYEATEEKMREHYFTTALFNAMFGMEYARRIAGQPVLIAAASPGLAETPFNTKDHAGNVTQAIDRSVMGVYVRTPEEGARTIIRASVDTKPEWATIPNKNPEYAHGKGNFVHLDNFQPFRLPTFCHDEALVKRVWNDTIALLGPERGAKLQPVFTDKE